MTKYVPNPYKKGLAAPPNAQKEQQQQQNQQQNSPPNQSTMGPQSQIRQGSVHAAKKHGAKRNRRSNFAQTAIGGGRAFAPHTHCPVCKANHINARRGAKKKVPVPHRGHHKLCAKNRKTRGLSETTVMVEKTYNKYYQRNNNLYYAGDVPKLTNAQAKLIAQNYFKPPTMPTITAVTPAHKSTPTAVTPAPSTTPAVATFSPLVPLTSGRVIRDAVDNLVKKHKAEKNPDLSATKGKHYPAELGLAIKWVCQQFTHSKPSNTSTPIESHFPYQSARIKYRQFFQPGSCIFTFPHEEIDSNRKPPSPHYHSIVGEGFIHLDWKLIDPTVTLCCHHCRAYGVTSHLVHERTNLSKNKTLFPIWTNSGRPIFAVVMTYKCERCESTCWANDGHLLASLPTHLSSIYPVDPTFATGGFHLHKNVSRELKNLMLTYGNGSMVSKGMFARMGETYQDKCTTYISQLPLDDFLTFQEFHAKVFPPNSATLRDLYLHSQKSSLTYYGYSANQRNKREIQSVEVGDEELVAIDWTFQVIKNYLLPGAKALFTMNKGSTKEICHAAVVSSTAVNQVSHALMEAKTKRKQFNPKGLYSDITPHNTTFWKRIFGVRLVVLLGLFHIMQRIVDTLDPKCGLYWDALVVLKECFYRFVESDFTKLRKSLLEGNLGEKMTGDGELNNVRRSKKWKSRYDTYLRKTMNQPAVAQNKLSAWVQQYKGASDETGRCVFNNLTEKKWKNKRRRFSTSQILEEPTCTRRSRLQRMQNMVCRLGSPTGQRLPLRSHMSRWHIMETLGCDLSWGTHCCVKDLARGMSSAGGSTVLTYSDWRGKSQTHLCTSPTSPPSGTTPSVVISMRGLTISCCPSHLTS